MGGVLCSSQNIMTEEWRAEQSFNLLWWKTKQRATGWGAVVWHCLKDGYCRPELYSSIVCGHSKVGIQLGLEEVWSLQGVLLCWLSDSDPVRFNNYVSVQKCAFSSSSSFFPNAYSFHRWCSGQHCCLKAKRSQVWLQTGTGLSKFFLCLSSFSHSSKKCKLGSLGTHNPSP